MNTFLTLSDKHKAFIRNVFKKYPGIRRVRIFGSYAKGCATSTSDIDIAYEGDISHEEQSQIWSHLTYDAPFLMSCDVVTYSSASPALREHIDRVGKDV